MTPKGMKDLYVRLILQNLPDEIALIDMCNIDYEREFGSLTEEIRESYEAHAYSHAQNYLLAAKDSLQTIHLLKTEEPKGTRVHCTIYGLGALLRQSLECLAYAEWLSSDTTVEILREKGFLFFRKNILDGLLYYREIGDQEAIARGERLLEDIREEGLSKGYLVEKFNKKTGENETKERLEFPGATKTCRRILTDSRIITETVLASYPGMSNAGFLFIWASGLTHGRHWVTLYRKVETGEVITSANYLNINLALFTIFELVKIVCENQKSLSRLKV